LSPRIGAPGAPSRIVARMSAAKSGNERYVAPDFAEPVIGRASARPIGAGPLAHQGDARLGRVLIKHAVRHVRSSHQKLTFYSAICTSALCPIGDMPARRSFCGCKLVHIKQSLHRGIPRSNIVSVPQPFEHSALRSRSARLRTLRPKRYIRITALAQLRTGGRPY
jgi:hypothetical protein